MTAGDVQAAVAGVVSRHRVGAFNGSQTACACDHTWRGNFDHEAHLTAAITAALTPSPSAAAALAVANAAAQKTAREVERRRGE